MVVSKNIAAFFFISLIFVLGCQNGTQPSSGDKHKIEIDTRTVFHEAVEDLTDVIVEDIFSPPVASRIYVYPTIAAYEVIAATDNNLRSLSGQLSELLPVKKVITQAYDIELAAILAFLETGKQLVFSQDRLDDKITKLKQKWLEAGISDERIQSSHQVGKTFATHILAWSKGDNYAETRSGAKYSYTDEPGKWITTPPAFMEGIEPNWRKLRLMVLDNLEDYVPNPPTSFSLEKGSQFYSEVLETKAAVDEATVEQKEIAAFWDCNPYVMNVTGHTMFASKKITPGGHWIGITSLAAHQSKLPLAQSIEVHALTAITLYDAFISCWDEKYRSNLVRPETVINSELDPDWKPFLQTPPFPEHTSGHSVISTAAARVLTQYFGDAYAYTDDVELKYGLPVRKFESFNAAAAEAAISRLYGGIHFRPAIEDGVVQGEKIAKQIIKTITTKAKIDVQN